MEFKSLKNIEQFPANPDDCVGIPRAVYTGGGVQHLEFVQFCTKAEGEDLCIG